ncbi:MAG: arsenate reductase ArsC [Sphingomicrobium sp.]
MDRVYNILFLCTGNSARSILAEAIVNRDGGHSFRAFSAGSSPRGEVHPQAIALLEELGYPTAGLRSKNWIEFAAPDAPLLDFVFTVCDNAAGESCPVWPGQPICAHWGIEDPAAAPTESQPVAFLTAFSYLKRRIGLFLSLPLDALDEMAIRREVEGIGRISNS